MSEATKATISDDASKDFQFEDADITLVSSDDVKFRIHRYQLQAVRYARTTHGGRKALCREQLISSPVLRSMF